MATVNFSVSEEIKVSFNATFAGQNKSAVIADLMREAVERAERKARTAAAAARLLERHAKAPVRAASVLRAARERGRP